MTIWMAALLMVASPGESSADATPARTNQEVRNAIRDVMAGEAQAKTPAARADAIRELCALYGEVVTSTTFVPEEQTRLKALVWSRLTRTKTEIEQRLARQRKAAELAAKKAARLGQNVSPTETAAAREATLAVASQVTAVSQAVGGPGALFAQAGGAFGGGIGAGDYGDELVDLIQKTISPDSWDVNGGPCSIVYLQHLHVLVVSAPDDVHGDLADVMDGLRRAGP